MEYDQGKQVGLRYHELSHLERTISDFENKARAYHKGAEDSPENETPAQKKLREEKLKRDLKHLDRERRRALCLIQVFTELEKYRRDYTVNASDSIENAEKKVSIMLEERHHPTKVLARFMLMVGRPRPSARHTPHHIVLGKGKTKYSAEARLNMHYLGIRINDPDNGVWMPMTKSDKGHWAMPDSPAHAEIHTHNYEEWVFESTFMHADERTFRTELRRIRMLLKSGRQPRKVTEPVDRKRNT
ncbi:AHH domain-containing protein [Hahella sp. CR1]|uniref:AHH domain-containing protein n=1 Tax=Hahella sp. CR1 TaxID=2992807 RepID=UPI00244190A2|nr:AHH domain-containing protein [Hahella sp. CR1]MDG9672235.1 AHH domain-containing protein [Hahella sp. CR1]